MAMLHVAVCAGSEGELPELKGIISETLDLFSVSYCLHEFSAGEGLLASPIIFQLVFLDIFPGDGGGIEVGAQLYRRNPLVRIIYQAAAGDFCREALNKAHAFAFLEKPLRRERLTEQLQDFLFQGGRGDIRITFKNIIYFRNGQEEAKAAFDIAVNEIQFFEYLKTEKKVKAMTEGGDFLCGETISALEDKMKPFGFAVSCRGILVNLAKIAKLKGYLIFLVSGEILPLSQKRVADFKARMAEYRG